MNNNSGNIVFQARNLSKTYNGLTALHKLSFEIHAGEIIGILGPNGAGKTTAMRILSTVIPPDKGNFSLMGIPNTQAEEIRALIGVLPENMGFPGYMTGKAYLTYIGRLYGLSFQKARVRAMELLSAFELERVGNSRVDTYSRGMRQRLGIARTLVNNPKLLFLDEPTLGFDPKGQQEMLHIIRDSAEVHQVAVLISSHLLEVVEGICSRVLILNEGKLIASGKISEITAKIPANPICRIRVAVEDLAPALDIVSTIYGIEVLTNPQREDEMVVTIPWGNNESIIHEILQSLICAGVVIKMFSRESIGLTDAFLSIIAEAQE